MKKYQLIASELRTEITSGMYDIGGKLPSEADLVDRFNASRPTIANALRELQSEDLIYRKAGAGTFLNASASSRTGGDVLGLLFPERHRTEIFESICGELGALTRVNHFGLLWGGSPLPYADRDASPEHARDVCKQFVEKRLAGVFFAPFEYTANRETVNRELLEMLGQAGIPVVLLDRDITPFPKRSDFDLVSIDNFYAGFMLAEHLIRLGAKKIKFLHRPESAPSVDARIGGVREAMIRYGLSPDGRFVVEGNSSDEQFVSKLKLGSSCDAIICANDFTAGELIKTLGTIKIRVPQELKVAGFDDVRYATLNSIALTTIRQPCRNIAEVAFRAMQERIVSPAIPSRTLTVAPRLIVRESCGNYLRHEQSIYAGLKHR